ncbi:MAG: DUF4124 domain-containing protein [Candidatus Thiodiazotropha sp.]
MKPFSKQQGVIGRIFLALILLAAIGGVAIYYTLYPDSLPEWASKTKLGRDIQTTTIYKWQDAAGAWHVSDQPPPKGTEYQVEKYARDTNVLPPLPGRE